MSDTERLALLEQDEVTQFAVACVERLLAHLKPTEGLKARAATEAVKAGAPDAAKLCEVAAEEVPRLHRCADLANECPPGWPDDDGPWPWVALAEITRAASVLLTDPVRAVGLTHSAAHSLTHGDTELQKAQGRWRRTRLDALIEKKQLQISDAIQNTRRAGHKASAMFVLGSGDLDERDERLDAALSALVEDVSGERLSWVRGLNGRDWEALGFTPRGDRLCLRIHFLTGIDGETLDYDLMLSDGCLLSTSIGLDYSNHPRLEVFGDDPEQVDDLLSRARIAMLAHGFEELG